MPGNIWTDVSAAKTKPLECPPPHSLDWLWFHPSGSEFGYSSLRQAHYSVCHSCEVWGSARDQNGRFRCWICKKFTPAPTVLE